MQQWVFGCSYNGLLKRSSIGKGINLIGIYVTRGRVDKSISELVENVSMGTAATQQPVARTVDI